MNEIVMIPIDLLHSHPDNPRKDLGDLTELAASIKESGLLQNLTVIDGSYMTEEEWNAEQKELLDVCREQDPDGVYNEAPYDPHDPRGDGFTVIIGHRRAAAARLAGLDKVPCVIADMDYKTQLATMLAENVQRSDLTPLEEANGFQMMMDLGMDIDEVAEKTGYTTGRVRRRLKIAGIDTSLIKADVSAISMKDLERVSQIENKYDRENATRALGTSEFAYRIERAESDQRTKKAKKTISDVVSKLRKGIKEVSSCEIGRSSYSSYWQLKTITYGAAPISVPENAIAYAVDVSNGGRDAKVIFGGVNNKKEKENDPAYQAEKHRAYEIKSLQWNYIRDIDKRAYERRFAFMRAALTKTVFRCPDEFLDRAGMFIFRDRSYNARRRFAALFDAKLDQYKWNEYDACVHAVTYNVSPTVLLAALVYAELDPGEVGHHKIYAYSAGDQAEYQRCAELDEVYRMLEMLGYEKDEEELRMEDPQDEMFDLNHFAKLLDEQTARGGSHGGTQ